MVPEIPKYNIFIIKNFLVVVTLMAYGRVLLSYSKIIAWIRGGYASERARARRTLSASESVAKTVASARRNKALPRTNANDAAFRGQ